LGFEVNKVSSAKVLYRELKVFPATIIPPLHHTHPFTSHQTCVFLPTDSVIKQHTFKAYLYEYNRMDSFLSFYFLSYFAFSNKILIFIHIAIFMCVMTTKPNIFWLPLWQRSNPLLFNCSQL
jgi:hypothetical protein